MCTHSHSLKFQLTVTPLGVLKKNMHFNEK